MPSFRSFSAPSSRSSPYSASSPRARTGKGPTGSETTTRRVLGDLDWWTVTEGQHPGTTVGQQWQTDNDSSNVQQDTIVPAQRPFQAACASHSADFSQVSRDWANFSLLVLPQTPRRRRYSESSLFASPGTPDDVEMLAADGLRKSAPAVRSPPSCRPPAPFFNAYQSNGALSFHDACNGTTPHFQFGVSTSPSRHADLFD